MEEQELKERILKALKEKGPMSSDEMSFYLRARIVRVSSMLVLMYRGGEIGHDFATGKYTAEAQPIEQE